MLRGRQGVVRDRGGWKGDERDRERPTEGAAAHGETGG